MTKFTTYSTEDFGLNPTDTDAHVPQFFMLKKWPADEPTGSRQSHPRSAAGKAKDRTKHKSKKQRSRQAKAKATAQAKTAAAAAAASAEAEESMELEATPEV